MAKPEFDNCRSRSHPWHCRALRGGGVGGEGGGDGGDGGGGGGDEGGGGGDEGGGGEVGGGEGGGGDGGEGGEGGRGRGGELDGQRIGGEVISKNFPEEEISFCAFSLVVADHQDNQREKIIWKMIHRLRFILWCESWQAPNFPNLYLKDDTIDESCLQVYLSS